MGALQKNELGPVTYDVDKCIGCRYCMVACPFNIPRYEWDNPVPAVRKCDMCIDRLKDGGVPACAEACKTDALVYGELNELIATGRASESSALLISAAESEALATRPPDNVAGWRAWGKATVELNEGVHHGRH